MTLNYELQSRAPRSARAGFGFTWLILWSFLAAAGVGCREHSDRIVLRMGHGLETSHPVHQAMEFMAAQLRDKSGGRVTLKIYPNSQLGSEREMIELVQLGAIDLTKTSTAPLEGFVPVMSIFSIPYVFRDTGHYWNVLDGPIGRRLLDASIGKKLKGLCYYDAGSRSFYTKQKPILNPADLRGLKIRVQNSRTAIEMIEAMGGSPTPIAFGELYTALQQGVVDGAENNPPSFLSSRHYEVCKHYSLDEHARVPDIVLMSTERWDRLEPQVRKWIAEAAEASARFQRQLWEERTQEAFRAVEKAGVQIARPDKAPFQQAVASMFQSYAGTEVGRLIDEIQQVR